MVKDCTWDDSEKKWKVSVETAKGSKEAEFSEGYEIKADFVVSAVGQLNVPQWPKIDGIDSFEGKKMHSARWDWSYGLEGKKIAMIGNGRCPRTAMLHADLLLINQQAVPPSKSSPRLQRLPNKLQSFNEQLTGLFHDLTLRSQTFGVRFTSTFQES
jgi:cation diffusion facilitator CzcD-associated flavoprotein CzcO